MTILRTLIATLLLVACSGTRHDFRIDVRTDWVPIGEFATFEVWLSNELGDVIEPRMLRPADVDYVEGANLTTYRVASGTHRAHVVLRDASGRIVASRSVIAEVRARTGTTILLSRECRDVTCPAGLECHGPRCVDPRCSPETPELCEGSCDGVTCDPAPAECAGPPVCVTGICLDSPGTCPEGEYCQPELGCLVLPASRGDAGPADAATDAPDAGPIVNGLHVDSRAFGSPQPLEATAISVAGARVCIGGQLFGSLDFGGGDVTAMAGRAPFVACFDDGTHAFSLVLESDNVSLDRLDDLHVSATGEVAALLHLRGMPLFDPGLTATGNNSYLVRLEADGDYAGALPFVAPSAVDARTLSVTELGEYIVGGSYRAIGGNGNFGTASLPMMLPDTGPQGNAFVAMYESDLSPRWAHSFGDLFGNDSATSTAFDAETVWVAGDFRNTATDDTGAVSSSAIGEAGDAFVFAYDRSDGGLQSFVRVGGIGADSATDLVASAGELFLTGTSGGGEGVGACIGGATTYLLGWSSPRTDLDVNRCIGGVAPFDGWRGMVAGPRDTLLLAQQAGSGTTFAGRNLALDGSDVLLTSFGRDGTERWGQRYGSGVDRPRAVAVEGDRIFVFGEFDVADTNFGGDVLMHVANTDLFVLELSED